MRGNSIVAAINATVCGMGISAVPCFFAESEPRLRRLTPRILGGRDIFLVVHPDLARVARVRAVMDFVVELFARDAAAVERSPAGVTCDRAVPSDRRVRMPDCSAPPDCTRLTGSRPESSTLPTAQARNSGLS